MVYVLVRTSTYSACLRKPSSSHKGQQGMLRRLMLALFTVSERMVLDMLVFW